MEKSQSKQSSWQRWLRFSAFTLGGVAMEGSMPPQNENAPPQAKKWRASGE
ncbi:hypothetical protein [Pantoea sp.]|uniref:hypothetical protein n=1 Tax=Pantoea sp. TaxID=69393 RepID=UPI0028A219F1|nr:hypothetical protein [Pantoea sp.]